MHFPNSSSRTPGQQPHQLPNLTNSIHALLSKEKVNAPASVFKLIGPAFQLTTVIVQHKAQDVFLALCTEPLRPAHLAGETAFEIPEILYRGREAKALTPRDRETVRDLFDRLVDHVDSINIASHDERHVYGRTKSFLDPTTARQSSEIFVSHDAVKAATVDEVWGVVDDNSIARLFSKGYWQDAEAEGCGKIDLEIVACATMFGSNGRIRTQWKPGKDRYWTQGVTLFPDVENTVLSRYKELRDLHDVQGE